MSKRSDYQHRQRHAFTVVERENTTHDSSEGAVTWACKCGHEETTPTLPTRAADARAYRDYLRHERGSR